jgi:predicted PurR-regulated permease PerM
LRAQYSSGRNSGRAEQPAMTARTGSCLKFLRAIRNSYRMGASAARVGEAGRRGLQNVFGSPRQRASHSMTTLHQRDVRGLAERPAPRSTHRVSNTKLLSLEQRVFFWVLILATIALVFLIQDFLQPLFWAALLAALFHPLHLRLAGRLTIHRSLSAGICLVAIVAGVVVPFGLILYAVVQQSSDIVVDITGELDVDEPVKWIQQFTSSIERVLEPLGITPESVDSDLRAAAVVTSKFIAARALSIGQNTLLLGVQMATMLYLLFFFIRDGSYLMSRLAYVLPLGDARERTLFRRFTEVAGATIKGTFVVASVQGALCGLALWVLGIPNPVLWGFVTTLLCLVPVIGAALVWGPVAVWFLGTGELSKGIGLILFGTFVIGLVDNVLRPILVGRDARLPDYVVLISTLGGIIVLGPSGFVIGPVVAALCAAGWEMLGSELHGNESHDDVDPDRHQVPLPLEGGE